MQAKVMVTKELRLILTEKEAIWLRKVIQIIPTYDNERIEDIGINRSFWDALDSF